MKKITLLTLFVALWTYAANAQEYFTNYGVKTHAGRYLNSISIEKNATAALSLSGLQTSGYSQIYFDRTTQIIEATAGDALKISYNWTGEWMHNIIYVDWDNNKSFSTSGDTERIGYNGANVSNELTKPINYTIPADKAPGDYRMRLMVDWLINGQSTNVNEKGSMQPINSNAGCVVDIILRITSTASVATPAFSPGTGTYHNPQTVSLTTVTENAEIRYTTNGDEPTASSELYNPSTPINVGFSATPTVLKAKAFKDGASSDLASATYTVTPATPQISVPTGTYFAAQTVTITSATTNGEIRYTLNGDQPSATSDLYSSAVVINPNTTTPVTLKAVVFKDGVAGAVAEATYTFSASISYCSFVPTNNTTAAYTQALGNITVKAGEQTLMDYSALNDTRFQRVNYYDRSSTVSLNVRRGQTITVDIHAGIWTWEMALYFDWNRDGAFEGEYRAFGSTESPLTNAPSADEYPGPLRRTLEQQYGSPRAVVRKTITITVPENAALGVSKFRVISDGDGAAGEAPKFNACQQVGYAGSLHQFELNVQEALPAREIIYTSSPANGTFTVKRGTEVITSGSSVPEQTVLTVDAVPAEGYWIKTIKVNNVAITGNTFTVTANSEITVEFSNDRQITLNKTGNGAVTITDATTNDVINPDAWVADQTQVRIKITPEANHRIVRARFAGTDILNLLNGNREYVTTVTQNSLIEVEFAPITHQVTYTFNSQLGSLTVTNNGTPVVSNSLVPMNSVLLFAFTPAAGCRLSAVEINGIDETSSLIVEGRNEFQYQITEQTALEVVFEKIKYRLTLPAVQNGAMEVKNAANQTLSNQAQVIYDQQLNVTLTPGTGYDLSSLIVNDGTGASDYLDLGYCQVQNGVYTTQVIVKGNTTITPTFAVRETVATPVITPGTGTYTQAQVITIETTTPDAIIYYTEDGSDPVEGISETNKRYNGAFSVGTDKTIKAIAVKAGMNNSAIATAIYTIRSASLNRVNGQEVVVFVQDNRLHLKGIEAGMPVALYTVSGKLLVSETATADTHTFGYELPDGAYILKVGAVHMKVVK